jgi:uncharacterized protein YegP (UPF0339 family)
MGCVAGNEVQKAANPDGFELYEDATSQWRWRHYSSGRITAESGESYTSRENCESALENLRKTAAVASVRIKTA